MTIVEMHELADVLIDKANGEWFTPEEKDIFLNLAIKEYVDKHYRQFEKDEEVRAKLNTIVYTTAVGSVTQITLDTITNFRYVLAVYGEYPNECGDLVRRKISPVQWDDYAENQMDPFNRNTDLNVGYVQRNVAGTGRVLDILSDTTGQNMELVYFKTPVDVLNDTVTPANNVDCELAVSAHEEIVNLAVRKMLGTVENQLTYQVQSNEIISQNQNPTQ